MTFVNPPSLERGRGRGPGCREGGAIEHQSVCELVGCAKAPTVSWPPVAAPSVSVNRGPQQNPHNAASKQFFNNNKK